MMPIKDMIVQLGDRIRELQLCLREPCLANILNLNLVAWLCWPGLGFHVIYLAEVVFRQRMLFSY